ncbi:MAG: nickel pincer cofactor biosynthesis protein LarC [Planctomycetes bacterium]|nr:nickel pincer cofactor biosynthesis protein LarC [Planctomycetota bacterium]
MRIGYFDCFCGAAGDMILGALVDAGCPLPALQETVAALKLPGVSLSAEKVDQKGIAATRVTVAVGPEPRKKHRHLPEIVSIIDRAGLKPRVADGAKTIFGRLAEAEATVHNTAVEKVHFHEVGAADAIVDIVCACAGLALLEIERVICSPIPTGRGTVTCEHGVMPIPAPATTLLLKGVPLADCDEPGELTTPTGAAILTTLADRFGPLPPMCIEAAGYGAGTRTGRTRANFLRLIIGETDAQESRETDAVCLLEAQVDDATGQVVAYACERLLEDGALDAYVVPIIMKKGRPGQLLTVLCRPDDVAALEAVMFRETTTLGIRRHACQRTKLARELVSVESRYGPIRVKVASQGGATLRVWPEYEDCAAAARRGAVSLRDVQQAALKAYEEQTAADPATD